LPTPVALVHIHHTRSESAIVVLATTGFISVSVVPPERVAAEVQQLYVLEKEILSGGPGGPEGGPPPWFP